MENKNDLPMLRIRPSKGWISLRLRDVWEYRQLLYFLIWRDVKVRYKQTALGAAWAIIQPVMTMVVFSIFFGKLGKIPSNGIPYPIFSFAALVPWTFFANALNQTSNSLVANSNLIKKIYFPRLVIPISSTLSGLVDYGISFLVLLVMMMTFGLFPSAEGMFWIPVFIFLTLTTALGIGLWLSAMNVEYRDIRYVVPFLTQFWLFASPIAYPSSLVPEGWRVLYGLNPMAGVIEGYRWALLGAGQRPDAMMAVSAVISFALLISGAFYFRRMEKNFADTV